MTSLPEIRRQYPQYDDMSDGDLLMGLHRKHYSDMHPREFLNRVEGAENAHATIRNEELKKHWRTNVVKPMGEETDMDRGARIGGTAFGTDVGKLEARQRAGFQGLTAGFGDEIVARGASALSGNPYEYELAAERARIEQGRERLPGDTAMSEVVGALAVPLPAMQAATVPGRVAQGAAAGAAFGGAYGFGSGEGGAEERLQDAGTGAAIGGMAGAAIPLAANRVGQAITRRARSRAITEAARGAESTEAMRRGSSALYDATQARGVNLKEEPFTNFVDDLTLRMRDEGIDKTLTPFANRAVNRLNKAKGKPLKLTELETLRKIATNASTTPNPADRRIAGQVVREIDDFVMRLVDDDVMSGNLVGMADDMKKARDMWGRMRRSERLEQAIESAKDAASGFENGMRIEFRKILKDKKFFNSLSPVEQQAVREVTRGTVVGNWLRRLGKMSFGAGQQTNMLGGMVGTGLGGVVGGPVGAIAAPAIGHVSQGLAERATLGLANRARGVVANPNVRQVAPTVLTGNALRPAARIPAVTYEP